MTATQTRIPTARQPALVALGLRCLRRLEAKDAAKRAKPRRQAKDAAPRWKHTTAALARLSARVASMTAAEKAEAARWLDEQISHHERQGAEIARRCLDR